MELGWYIWRKENIYGARRIYMELGGYIWRK